MRLRLLLGALVLALLTTACPQRPEVASCDLGEVGETVPDLVGDAPAQRHVLAVLHQGIGEAVQGHIPRLIDDAVASRSKITIWTLRSSQASGMERIVDEDFGGSAETESGVRFELRRPRAEALCAALDASNRAALDDGADLLGAVERLINEAGSGETATDYELVILTGGGVHRTNELNLGDVGVTPASFEPRLARILEALQRSANLPTSLEITGVATFEGVASPPSREIADLATRLWTDVCDVVNQEGVSCSPTP